MRIGIAYDLAPGSRSDEGPDDRFEEFDKPETVEAIAAVLRGEGHEVVLLGDGRSFLYKILENPVDLVWNQAEGEGIGRCRESRVPAVLEMLGIPCTGSDPLTLAAALDKPLAKRLVSHRVAVPGGSTFREVDSQARIEASLARGECGPPPWIVKPAFEGSSKGIRTNALVDTGETATGLVLALVRDYRQPILVEEFIEGDEVTVGLIGNGATLDIIGLMRVRPRSNNPRFIYSIEVKRDWDEQVEYETPIRLPGEQVGRIELAAREAYEALGCRDLARIDFRVRDGIPYFLEANPLPGLAPDWSDLVILAKGYGISHSDLIKRVLHAALTRLGALR